MSLCVWMPDIYIYKNRPKNNVLEREGGRISNVDV